MPVGARKAALEVQTILKFHRAMHLASPPSIIYLCLKLQGTFRKLSLATLKDSAFQKQVTSPDPVSFLPPFLPQELEMPP